MNEELFLVIAHRRSELTLTFDIVGEVCWLGDLYLLATFLNYLKLCSMNFPEWENFEIAGNVSEEIRDYFQNY